MIPVLFNGSATTFTSNGIGRLADAISCNVVEERNGIYELSMKYHVNGVHYADISEGKIIVAMPFDGGQRQAFIIYKVTKPLDGIVTINAEHISYRLSGLVVMPFTASTLTETVQKIPTYCANTFSPFTLGTDKTSTKEFSFTEPKAVRELLSGEGSLLDVYGGGDYEFNNFSVYLHSNRGTDNHVTLRYGKNITSLKNIVDMTSVYTSIVPYWTDGDTTVTITEKVVNSAHTADYPFQICRVVDFSKNFEDAPSESDLRAAATAYVNNNKGWKLKNTITVSFVALWETEEYKSVAPLERVRMCDTVRVYYEKLGVNFTTQVIKTDFDVLAERYNSITLGTAEYTMAGIIDGEIEKSEQKTSSRMKNAIERATKLIQGGLGGHVVFNTNADGEPEEILIMDTDDIATATYVLRMNLNGIGFSDSGYNGPFDTAWTLDGHFVADYIDTGTLNADLIKTGTLNASLATITNINASNINTGALNASLITTGTLDASKATITNINASNINTGALNASLITTGTLDASKATVTNLNASNLTSGTINASVIGVTNINASNITSGTINASVVSVTNIDASNITTGSMSADRITTGTLNAANVSVTNINASNITSGEMSASRIKGGTLQLGVVSGYADGEIEVTSGSGSTSGNISINKNGIQVLKQSYGSTTGYTKINNSGVTVGVYNQSPCVILDANNNNGGSVTVTNNLGGKSTNYTEIGNVKTKITGSSSSYYAELGGGTLSIAGTTYSDDILKVTGASSSNHNALSLDGWAYLPGIRGGAIYADSTHIGFFGKTSGTTKQTIAKASTGTSATASNCAEKLNALLTALNSYGLITSS